MSNRLSFTEELLTRIGVGWRQSLQAARTFLDADLDPSTTYSYAVYAYANKERTEYSNIAYS